MDSLWLMFLTCLNIDIPTESAADNLAEDLVHDEDNQGPEKDNPAECEKNKCKHKQRLVTKWAFIRIQKLNLMKYSDHEM